MAGGGGSAWGPWFCVGAVVVLAVGFVTDLALGHWGEAWDAWTSLCLFEALYVLWRQRDAKNDAIREIAAHVNKMAPGLRIMARVHDLQRKDRES